MGIENAKVSIIGAGSIGAQTACTLTQANIVSEIVIVNRDETKTRGKAMDISHGAALSGNTCNLGEKWRGRNYKTFSLFNGS